MHAAPLPSEQTTYRLENIVTERESMTFFFLRQVLAMLVFALQPLGEGGRGDGDDSGGSSRLALRLMTCDVKPG